MEIILIENVDNLGLRGDVVEVKNGYARNYLIPKGMAIKATSGNIKMIEQQRKKIETLKIQEKSEAEAIRDRVEQVEIEVVKKAGEKGVLFGSVTMQEIGDLLAKEGFEIDKRKISTPETIKTTGVFIASVRLYPKVAASLKVTVITEEDKIERDEQEAAAAVAAAEAAAEKAAESTEETDASEEPVEEVTSESSEDEIVTETDLKIEAVSDQTDETPVEDKEKEEEKPEEADETEE